MDALDYVESRHEQLAAGTGVTWAVADPEDDQMLGSIGWFDQTPGVQVEIGYRTHRDARGRGLMTRALTLLTGHLFETLDLLRVTAHAAVANAASRHVIESAGFRQFGVERHGTLIRAGRAHLALYDVTAAQWSEGAGAEGPRSARDRSRAKDAASTNSPPSERPMPSSNGER